MNKDYYKRTFSAVHPSADTLERILEMPEKKRKIIMPRKLIGVFAVLTTVTGGMLTANAATDGAVLQSVQDTVQEGVQFILNGKKVNVQDYVTSHKTVTGKDGQPMDIYDIRVPDEKGGDTGTDVHLEASSHADLEYRLEMSTEDQQVSTSIEIREKADDPQPSTNDTAKGSTGTVKDKK